MKKVAEIVNPTSCLNRAGEDEPLFVLRAKDPLAANCVRQWAVLARDSGRHEADKIESALRLADSMETWRRTNHPEPEEATTDGSDTLLDN